MKHIKIEPRFPGRGIHGDPACQVDVVIGFGSIFVCGHSKASRNECVPPERRHEAYEKISTPKSPPERVAGLLSAGKSSEPW